MKNALTPHITEKSYRLIELTEKDGATYTFKIPLSFSKEQVKAMVEKQYKVSVLSVNTVRIGGKTRRFRNVVGKTSDYKKALVHLKKGDKIAGFEVESKNQPEDKE